MKICPRCHKTYPDDNLNFCLEDGTVLTAAPASDPMLDTVVQHEPRMSQPPPSPQQPPQMMNQPVSQQQPAWNPPQQYPVAAKKSSKTWIWVVAILLLLGLVCGGGLIAAFFWAASQADRAANTVYDYNRSASPTPAGNRSSTTTTSGRSDVTKLDLNMFVKEGSLYGTTELEGDTLTMGSKKKGFYYVLVAPDKYKTDSADTRVTITNTANADSSLGYGLIFHSNPDPLQQDYAFLIDTKKKKYRLVHHEPQKETPVVNWTSSPAINGGSADNTLEVRDQSDKMEFYINGTMVTSSKNTFGYGGGVVGLYSGDGAKIAFKNLEIRK